VRVGGRKLLGDDVKRLGLRRGAARTAGEGSASGMYVGEGEDIGKKRRFGDIVTRGRVLS
jgi:hypothetical protein